MKPPFARNIAEVIDDLYRQHAPPRNHERMIELVRHQIEHAMRMAVEEERRRRDLVDPARRHFRSADSAQAPVNPSINRSNEQKFGATEQDPAGGQSYQ